MSLDLDTFAALRRGVVADPASDVPRLAFADFLEEAGVEEDWVTTVRRGPGYVASRTGRVAPRDWSLTDFVYYGEKPDRVLARAHAHCRRFRPRSPAVRGFVVRRGFVSQVRCRMRDFLVQGVGWVASMPLESVTVFDRAASLRDPGDPGLYYRLVSASRILRYRASSFELPAEVFGGRPGDFVEVGDRREAREWLSAALLAWARREAERAGSFIRESR